MIVYGGQFSVNGNGRSSGGVWILDHANGLGGGPVWRHLDLSAAAGARQNHQAVYDQNGHMIVFGGLRIQPDPSAPVGFSKMSLNDVWVLDNANQVAGTPSWRQVTLSETEGVPIQPSPRHSVAAAYDIPSNQLVVFGGCAAHEISCTPSQTSTELWRLSNARGDANVNSFWKKLSYAAGTPVPE